MERTEQARDGEGSVDTEPWHEVLHCSDCGALCCGYWGRETDGLVPLCCEHHGIECPCGGTMLPRTPEYDQLRARTQEDEDGR